MPTIAGISIDCLKNKILMIAVNTIPTPAQMAYAMPKGMVLTTQEKI